MLDGVCRLAIIHPVMEWHYSKNGVQLGPVSREELLLKKQGGEILPSDLVWKQGMADWMPLAQVSELAGGVPAVAPSYTPLNGPVITQKIPNYLWQSIASTVLCCTPFGIVAIVYAAKVDGLAAKGDIAGAMAASKSAKTWINVSVISYVVVMILVVIGSAVSES